MVFFIFCIDLFEKIKILKMHIDILQYSVLGRYGLDLFLQLFLNINLSFYYQIILSSQ